MARVEPTDQAVIVRPPLGRSMTYYYEELQSAAAEGGQLVLKLHDGRQVTARVGSARAAELARQIASVVSGTAAALARTNSLKDLRHEVDQWLEQRGFAAAPFVDYLLRATAGLEASDLHLEPRQGGTVSICLRLDGVLHEAGVLPPELGRRTVGRLKVMAGVKAHRTDIPQEGRAGVDASEWARMSFVPSVAGESATVRLFDRLKGQIGLDELGLGEPPRGQLEALLAEPRGLLLLAGPSASGKSTTMYTCLKALIDNSNSTLRAITVEDPVEYRLDGVVQLEAAPARGNTGALLLKSVLRQDADVLAVGEVRDAETAHLVIEAGMTGHRVLSTIHAGSAAEALVRLLELGLKPGLLGSALVGVVAQRLVRRRCTTCGGQRCEGCNNTGYQGRRALAEVVPFTDELRETLSVQGAPSLALLERAARAAGMVPLRVAAGQLVEAGVTDEAEVSRALGPAWQLHREAT